MRSEQNDVRGRRADRQRVIVGCVRQPVSGSGRCSLVAAPFDDYSRDDPSRGDCRDGSPNKPRLAPSWRWGSMFRRSYRSLLWRAPFLRSWSHLVSFESQVFVPLMRGVSPTRDSKEKALQDLLRGFVLRSPSAYVKRAKDDQRAERNGPHLDKGWRRRNRAERAVDVLRRMIGSARAREPEGDQAKDREQDEDQERHSPPQVSKRDHARSVAPTHPGRHLMLTRP